MDIMLCPVGRSGTKDCEGNPLPRETRLLLGWAWILQNAGHKVRLVMGGSQPSGAQAIEEYSTLLGLECEKLDDPRLGGGCECFIAASAWFRDHSQQLPRYQRLIVLRNGFPLKNDFMWCDIPHVVVANVWRREDFTDYEARGRPPNDPRYLSKIDGRILMTPWVIHDDLWLMLSKEDLIHAYLQDDVATIRQHYATSSVRTYGFLGMPNVYRTAIASNLQGEAFSFCWTGSGSGTSQIVFGDYLRWIAGCRSTLDLPGDTWNSYRFGESTLMGVPIATDYQRFQYKPTLSEDNCVMVRDWTDKDALLATIERLPKIAKGSDTAYREGWSPRGQLKQALKKANLEL